MTSFLTFDGATRHQPEIDLWLDARSPDLAPRALPDETALRALIKAAYADIKRRQAAERSERA